MVQIRKNKPTKKFFKSALLLIAGGALILAFIGLALIVGSSSYHSGFLAGFVSAGDFMVRVSGGLLMLGVFVLLGFVAFLAREKLRVEYGFIEVFFGAVLGTIAFLNFSRAFHRYIVFQAKIDGDTMILSALGAVTGTFVIVRGFDSYNKHVVEAKIRGQISPVAKAWNRLFGTFALSASAGGTITEPPVVLDTTAAAADLGSVK